MHTFLFPMVRQWHFSCMVDEFIITYVIFLKDSVYKKYWKWLIFDVSYSKIICGLFEISYDLSCIESAVNLTNLSFWIVWVLVANCHIGAWYLCYGWLCILFSCCADILLQYSDVWHRDLVVFTMWRYASALYAMVLCLSVTSQCSTKTVLNAGGVG